MRNSGSGHQYGLEHVKHVLFVHIQKTGGISIQAMIRRHDGPTNPAYVSNFVGETDWTTVSQYKYHFTHGLLCIRELLPRPLFVFTILRDPVDRAISLYNHYLRMHGERVHEVIIGERLDFAAALTHPELSSSLTNAATRILGTEVDVRAAWPNASAMSLAERWALQVPPDEGTYQRALENLKQLDFVGFTERLEEDARDLAALLRFEVDEVPRANAEPEDYPLPLPRAARSAEAEAAVRLHSAFDCRLYDEARKLFWVRDTTRHEFAVRAVSVMADYTNDTGIPVVSAADPYPIPALRTRIRQLEADLTQKFAWAQSYKLLADSLEQKVREIEADRDRKFEWAQNYKLVAESAQQSCIAQEQRIRVLEAERDSLASQLEAETRRSAALAQEADNARAELARVTSSRTFRLASALGRIWRHLRPGKAPASAR
jgi:hypothetical protein